MQVYLAQRQTICPISFYFICHQSAGKHKLRRLAGTLDCNESRSRKHTPNLSCCGSQVSRNERQNATESNDSTESINGVTTTRKNDNGEHPDVNALFGDTFYLTGFSDKIRRVQAETKPTLSSIGGNSLQRTFSNEECRVHGMQCDCDTSRDVQHGQQDNISLACSDLKNKEAHIQVAIYFK